jgi:cold shock CspA family protein
VRAVPSVLRHDAVATDLHQLSATAARAPTPSESSVMSDLNPVRQGSAGVRRRGSFSGRGRSASFSFLDYVDERGVLAGCFVHITAMPGEEWPDKGSAVEFEISSARDGRQMAINVTLLD